MFNVYEVKLLVDDINGSHGGYENIVATYRVFCMYEETAKRYARKYLMEDYPHLKNLAFGLRYEVKLLLKGVIKGAC